MRGWGGGEGSIAEQGVGGSGREVSVDQVAEAEASSDSEYILKAEFIGLLIEETWGMQERRSEVTQKFSRIIGAHLE